MEKRLEVYNKVFDLDSRLPNNIIMTPRNVAYEMISMLDKIHQAQGGIWTANNKFLDPVCKSGIYLKLIFEKLMNSNDDSYNCEECNTIDKKRQYIIKNQLYGVVISSYCADIVRREIFGKAYIKGNIVDTIDYSTIIACMRTRNIDEIYNKIKGTFNNMKFDVVIGNPPYNDNMGRGNGGGGNALYPAFMALAIKLSKRYSSLIIPSAWMILYPQGSKHDDIDKIRRYSKFKELHDFKDCSKVFSNVSIPSGVCYYLVDLEHNVNICKHYVHNKDNSVDIIDNLPLFNARNEVIFRDKNIIDILKLIENTDGKNYITFNDKCAGNKDYFDNGRDIMIGPWNGYSLSKTDEYSIKYYVNERTHHIEYGYVGYNQIPKNSDDYKKHKIIIGQAFTAGSSQVIDIPKYIGNNSVCSQSFIPIFSVNNTEEECINIISYMKTKFFRYLVQCMKADQNLSTRTFSLVPMQDFSHPWTDEMLYKRYKLSDNIIELIEKSITEMI